MLTAAPVRAFNRRLCCGAFLASLALAALATLIVGIVFMVQEQDGIRVKYSSYPDDVPTIDAVTPVLKTQDMPFGTQILLARLVPLEFDPSQKLACHNSNYTSTPCNILVDRFCSFYASNPWHPLGCNFTKLETDLTRLNHPQSARRGMADYAGVLIAWLREDEVTFGVPPTQAELSDLSSAPELEAEFNSTRAVAPILTLARQTTRSSHWFWNFWNLYGSAGQPSLDSFGSAITLHVTAKAIALTCQAPEFRDRLSFSANLTRYCAEEGFPSSPLRSLTEVRALFWQNLQTYPESWESSLTWLSAIPALFEPAALRASAVQGRAYAANFIGAMGVPAVDACDCSSDAVFFDRLSRAAASVESARTDPLWVAAAEAIDASQTAEALLSLVRWNQPSALASNFWPKFFAAKDSEQIASAFAEFRAQLANLGQADAPVAQECSICQEMHADEQTRCKHWYHRGCLTDWLRRKNNCPICRTAEPRTP